MATEEVDEFGRSRRLRDEYIARGVSNQEEQGTPESMGTSWEMPTDSRATVVNGDTFQGDSPGRADVTPSGTRLFDGVGGPRDQECRG